MRLKNPINSSKKYKDDERIKAKEEETQRQHEEWQAKMAARAKKRAQLEINLRVEYLKKTFYSLGFDIASVWCVIYSIRRDTKVTIAASSFSESKFSHQAVHKIISDLSEPRANVFGFKIPVAERRPAHGTRRTANPAGLTPTGLTETEDANFVSTPNPADETTHILGQQSPTSPTEVINIGNHSTSAMANDYLSFAGAAFSLVKTTTNMSINDRTILRDIVLEMKDFLINITFKLWDNIDDKDEAAKINAALKAKRQLKRVADATANFSQMLSNVDLANPPKDLDNDIDKRHKKQVANLRHKLKNEF